MAGGSIPSTLKIYFILFPAVAVCDTISRARNPIGDLQESLTLGGRSGSINPKKLAVDFALPETLRNYEDDGVGCRAYRSPFWWEDARRCPGSHGKPPFKDAKVTIT